MRARHIKFVVLILAVQCAFGAGIILSQSAALSWLGMAAGIGFLIIPFIGYIAALYDLPLLARFSPILRTACLTLFSTVATFAAGYAIYLFLWFIGIPMIFSLLGF
jgi:hypothetical protein